jgi:hypothetical protein
MKYTVTKVTTTSTSTTGGKLKTTSQGYSQNQQKKSSGGSSIIQTFSSQKASPGFKDNLFQPSDESLYSSKQEVQDYQMQKIPKFLREKKKVLLSQFALSQKEGRYSWARLGDILEANKLNVFKDTRELPLDVVQGELGDCYFLSVLAAFAEDPNIIASLVDAKGRGSDGAFTANVIIHGEPVKVVVDDEFPVANNSKLAFAGLNENSGNLWPLILEKAWAKCNKSYEDIIPGNSADAFEFLSPAPFNTYYHNSETRPTLFETIRDAQKKGFIVLADITETMSTNLESLSRLGLITNHSYTIINTAVLRKSNGSEIKLLKIMNIWGTNEWVGDWSDTSSKWTQEFKKEVGLEPKEEGIFWMSYDDYLQFYTTTHICKIHPDYDYKTTKFKSSKENNDPLNLSKVVVRQSGSGYFIVNQKNTRIYRNLKDPEYENPFCNMVVFRDDDKNGYTFIGSESGKQDRLYVECEDLSPGTYYISVTFPKSGNGFALQQNFENIDNNVNFRVGVYSSLKQLNVEPLSEKELEEVPGFAFEMVSNLANENKDKYYFAQEGEAKSFRVINFDNNSNGFGYIYYKNDSDAYLRERAEISSLQNVVIIPFLKNGVCISDEKEEEDKPSVLRGGLPSSLKFEIGGNELNEKVDYESKNVSNAIKALKGKELDSNLEVLEGTQGKEVSGNSPAVVQFNIAPHSECVIYLQKADEESDIDLNSDLCFDYLPNILLEEQKFNSKKYKLRYNNKPVEIYECVAEHNTGVFFIYKNRDAELRVQITAKFTKRNNLYLAITSSDLEEGGMKLRKPNGDEFREEGGETVTISVEPGETGFFGLSAIDSFEKFSYTCQFDYLFTVAKVPAKFQQYSKEEEVVVEGDEE